jgi:aminodeoxyfutalosine synthase
METVSALDGVAERVEQGEALSDVDAQAILDAHDVITIGMLGDAVRRKRHGARTTFVRVLEMHVDAPIATLPPRVAAGEFRIVGMPATADAAVAAVRSAATLAGATPLTGFALSDLLELAGSLDSLRALARQLRSAGLHAVADVPIDKLPDAAAAVETARSAGLAAFRMTVHAMAESQRSIPPAAAARLQEAVGGFRSFAPLPRSVRIDLPTTGYDDVKQVALARLLVRNIESIQVDWPLYGPKLAQVALTVGADDVDGIVAADPGLLGTRRSPIEEILGNIRAAGLEPIERNGRFEHVGNQNP